MNQFRAPAAYVAWRAGITNRVVIPPARLGSLKGYKFGLVLTLTNPVAKFIVPDWGDKVDSGIGVSYRPAKLHRLEGRYDNPMPESTISPSQGL